MMGDFGNGNGFPEPGEQGLLLTEDLFNQGGITSTQIIANLTSLTAGVSVDTAASTYTDIAARRYPFEYNALHLLHRSKRALRNRLRLPGSGD